MGKRILIIKGDSSGCFPVPATRGGAVQTLIEQIVCQNEIKSKLNLEIVSFYDAAAEGKAKNQYPNTVFRWIKVNGFTKILDKLAYWFFSKLLRKKNSKSYSSVFSALHFISKSAKLLKKESYDAVILENYIPLVWIIKKSKYEGKFFFHLHNIPKTDAKCKKYLNKCSGFICVSQFVADEIAKAENPIGPIPKDKLFVLLNGVDTDKFKKITDRKLLSEERNKLGITEEDKVLLFAGRLCKEKGVDIFLKALKNVDLTGCKVLIAGGTNFSLTIKDDYYKYLLNLASDLGDKVIFTGYVSYDEMPYIYNIAELVVLPSIAVEACPLAIGESISTGCQVITINIGGIPEIADDCATILNIDQNLEKKLLHCLQKYFEGEKVLKSFSVENYQKRHSLSAYYDKFVDIVDLMLSGDKT